MRKAVPILALILAIVFIAVGLMIPAKPLQVDKTTQQTGGTGDDGYAGTDSYLNENGQVNLNDIALYNGIISEISVSPTVVTYDYNHDGIADVKKTVLFFNIG
jgi:hypothetical protein